MTAALSGWAIGEALWIYYESIAHQSPFPSLADAAYLLLPNRRGHRDGVVPGRLYGPFPRPIHP